MVSLNNVNKNNLLLKVCVLGLGYVGLTLALSLADNGVKVLGLDNNAKTILTLRKGISTVSEKNIENILEKHLNKNFKVEDSLKFNNENPTEFNSFDTNDFFDAFLICVGTPLDDNNNPMLNHVIAASKQVGSIIKKNSMVILRSTIPIGTTRNTIKPIIEEISGLVAGKDFSLVFAPERTIEGAALSELKSNPQIIGSLTSDGIEKASTLFMKLTPTIVPVSNLETAEMIKLIDNTYRDVHFAFSNELALICENLNLNVYECIQKANYDYSRNNIPVPSPGVGGPCLSKDPIILKYSTNEHGYNPEIITHSRLVNQYLPSFLAQKIIKKLDLHQKNKQTTKIFILGFAFKGKPETSDIRNSPTITLVNELKNTFSENVLYGYDPLVPIDEIEQLGVKYCNVDEGFKNADCVVIMNNNDSFLSLDLSKLLETSSKSIIFVDCWYMFKDSISKINFPDQKIIYTGIGFD